MKKTIKVLALSSLLTFAALPTISSCTAEDVVDTLSKTDSPIVISGMKSLKPGETCTLIANFVGESEDVKWLSTSPEVATISDAGVVTAVSAGETEIVCQALSDAKTRGIATITVLPSESDDVSEYVTVTFVDYDGTVLDEMIVKKGTVPEYKGKTPTRISDSDNSYAFAGWDKEFGAINSDTTYTAVYDPIPLTDFEFAVDIVHGGYMVTGYSGASTEIEIPATFAFRKVSSIGDGAFSGNTTLTKVTLPEGLIYIGEQAFYGCTGITDMNIPLSVTTFGAEAFSNCSSWKTSVVLGDGVTDIPENCFYNCYSLPRVDGHENLLTIGRAAFGNCYVLVFEFSDKITHIDGFAFETNTALIHVELPDSITYLGESVFCHCSEMFTLKLPKNLETIDYEKGGYQSLTLGCNSLYQITIDESNPNFKTDEGHVGLYSKDGKILYTVAVTGTGEYDILDTCEEIKGTAFYNFAGTKIVIPKSVKLIDTWAFWNSEVDEIVFENGGTELDISDDAFDGCNNLKTVTLPDHMVDIPNNMFRDCAGLEEIVLSDKTETLGNYVFYNCERLSSVTLPEGLTSIGTYCFYDTAIKEITIPAGVTTINSSTFYNCTELKSVTFLGDITSLGSSSFSGSGLETFDIPDTVTKINSYAFRYCNQLKSIELPTSLKGTSAISSNAFTSCTALEEITFGPGLSDSELGSWSLTVPANTFTNDANIKTINFRGSEVAFSKVTVKDTNLQKLVASGQITINFNYGM